MIKVKIKWEKVIKADDFDSNIEFLMSNGGLYLWIWPGRNPRVGYVGETFNFYNRHLEHFNNIIGGRYLLFKPSPDIDFLDFLKEHFDGKTIEELNKDDGIFVPILNAKRELSITKIFLDENKLRLKLDSLKQREFAFATLEFSKNDDNEAMLRKQIEGALINELFEKYRILSGAKLKLKRAGNFCRCVIGDISKWPETDIEIIHEGLTDRIPQEVIEIKRFKV